MQLLVVADSNNPVPTISSPDTISSLDTTNQTKYLIDGQKLLANNNNVKRTRGTVQNI